MWWSSNSNRCSNFFAAGKINKIFQKKIYVNISNHTLSMLPHVTVVYCFRIRYSVVVVVVNLIMIMIIIIITRLMTHVKVIHRVKNRKCGWSRISKGKLGCKVQSLPIVWKLQGRRGLRLCLVVTIPDCWCGVWWWWWWWWWWCIRRHFAVACSLGTWYNLATGTCEFCPAGTYQDTEGQLSCEPCPHKLYGVGTQGAKNITECGGTMYGLRTFPGKTFPGKSFSRKNSVSLF